MHTPKQLRNIAIIAHIDHGKTTLIDSLLQYSHAFQQHEEAPERVLDSFELEKERGITIFAKHTSLEFEDYKINLIDTPGHADFSGEVERVLGMVNGVLLLVDAKEGPMPQTRFVLAQALRKKLPIVVVLNKIDRPHADPDHALNRTFDLFVELGADDVQLDFPYCYSSALSGYAMQSLEDPRTDMKPLFELIISKVPPPPGDPALPFLMQVSTLTYDDYLGRGATGRILEGSIRKGDSTLCIAADGTNHPFKVTKIEGRSGIHKKELESTAAGDIATLFGIESVMIGDTFCSPSEIVQLPPITLSDPTISIEITVNSSPFVGKEGKHVTMNKIKDRLLREKRANVSLRIEELDKQEEAISVAGKGELHLAILLETMRREGYEFSVSKPKVITKKEADGLYEPYDSVHIEVPEVSSGAVIEGLNQRKAELKILNTNEHGVTTMQFYVPTRGIIGYRNEFLTVTKGQGIMTSSFDSYGPWKGEIPGRKKGVLISGNRGAVTPYAAFNLQSRGELFVSPGDQVYEGMIVGEHNRENDLVVNIIREKHLTNVRASGSDENIILVPVSKLTLERAITYIEDDELIEITPKTIRLRKALLTENERKRPSVKTF